MFATLQNQINTLLWQTRLNDVSPLQASAIKTLRIFYGVIRDITGGLPSIRAMSLVYITLISLVPLLAVSFSVLKGFGVHNQLEPALINLLEPLGEKGLQLSQTIISFVDQVKVGVLGSIGLLVLIFSVLSLVKNYPARPFITFYRRRLKGIVQFFGCYQFNPDNRTFWHHHITDRQCTAFYTDSCVIHFDVHPYP